MRALLLLLLLPLAGCWNGDHAAVDLGEVSLGRHLLDLKEARDGGAITPDEYESLKRAVIDGIMHVSEPPTKVMD